MNQQEFVRTVWGFYNDNKRTMPWRDNPEPYWVLVSELMLQQTQVNRVLPKFEKFVQTLPTLQRLAYAELGDVLALWSGLGYNRRAKYLHDTAKQVESVYGGVMPSDVKLLCALPGIGPNTAGAIAAYAYNKPAVFIETNIRSAYIHAFFKNQTDISDAQIIEKLQKTLDTDNPRKWYWALMDYGSYIKSKHANPSRQSKHHVVQSKFSGSRRQLRGSVLKALLERPMTYAQLQSVLNDHRLTEVLERLLREGLISEKDSSYHLGA